MFLKIARCNNENSSHPRAKLSEMMSSFKMWFVESEQEIIKYK